MKRLTTLLAFTLLFGLSLNGQITDYNKIILPVEQRPKTFEDHLVKIAWTNRPNAKILATEVQIAENEIDLEKKKWAKDIQATFNMNEISLSKLIYGDRIDVPVFYPIYNFSASVNLGTFINRKQEIENKQLEKLITEQEVNTEKLEVRREVLERYQNYLTALEIFNIRIKAQEAASQTYTLLSEQFKRGKAELEDFNKATENYFAAQENRQQAQADVNIAKLTLEEMLGVTYEQAKRSAPKEK